MTDAAYDPTQGLVQPPAQAAPPAGVLGGLLAGPPPAPQGGNPISAYFGAIVSHLNAVRAQAAMQQWQNQVTVSQMQAQRQGLMEMRNEITKGGDPKQLAMFDADPFGYVKEQSGIHQMDQGQTLGTGFGGTETEAPKTGITDAGQPYSLTSQAFQTLGPQLPGKKEVKDGVVNDTDLGPVGTYSQPQKLAPAEVPGAYTPTVSGIVPAAAATPGLPVSSAPDMPRSAAAAPVTPPAVSSMAPRRNPKRELGEPQGSPQRPAVGGSNRNRCGRLCAVRGSA